MSQSHIGILGAGLSGLRCGHLLQKSGLRASLFEARDRLGGRILSHQMANTSHLVDLGPAWTWPEIHPRMQALIRELGLEQIPQNTTGAMLYEMHDGTLHRLDASMASAPASTRLAQGMQSLIAGLSQHINPSQIHLQSPIHSITLKSRESDPTSHVPPNSANYFVEVETLNPESKQSIKHCLDQVISTLPPRLLAPLLHMENPTPEFREFQQALSQVPTWMAGHAKFAVAYPRAFWREAGFSGMAMSQRGPLSEIHDASDPEGQAPALFGFVGWPASYRQSLDPEAFTQLALQQLARFWGPEALEPLWTRFQDWNLDPWTASPADAIPPREHPEYTPPKVPSPWNQHLILAGTENASVDGGYLEGALASAETAVAAVIARNQNTPTS